MDPAAFDELQLLLARQGPDAALGQLASQLREEQDYEGLFYTRLMAARHRLGVVPLPTGPVADIPDDKQEAYEDAIRVACREVGQLYLAQGNLAQAFNYFRMIGETEAVRQALADLTPDPDADLDPLLRITLHEGLLPRRGFEWLLGRFGTCSAITTLSGSQLPISPDDRRWCVARITRHLYEELCERVAGDIERRDGAAPEMPRPQPIGTLRQLMAGRDWLFGEDCYHIDLSHLSSVVQMSLDLEPGVELEMARELCGYGERLSPTYRNPADPPFDEPYKDQGVYLSIIAGDNVECGLRHFGKKAQPGTDEVGTGPAEVLVQLLQRLGRLDEALRVARKHLASAEGAWMPFLTDLCRKAGDYRPLADAARERGNAVQYLAGLLASRK